MRRKVLRGHPIAANMRDAVTSPVKQSIVAASQGYRMQKQQTVIRSKHLRPQSSKAPSSIVKRGRTNKSIAFSQFDSEAAEDLMPRRINTGGSSMFSFKGPSAPSPGLLTHGRRMTTALGIKGVNASGRDSECLSPFPNQDAMPRKVRTKKEI